MPVIPDNKVADKKRIILKRGQEGGKALRAADPQKCIREQKSTPSFQTVFIDRDSFNSFISTQVNPAV
jgi:hypothetical protein